MNDICTCKFVKYGYEEAYVPDPNCPIHHGKPSKMPTHDELSKVDPGVPATVYSDMIKEINHLKTCCVIEAMQANPNVDSYIKQCEKEIEQLKSLLEKNE